MEQEALQVFSNPVTGERAITLTDPREHPDEVLVSHLFVAPGGRVAAPHWHDTIRERFLILSGQVGFMIDGRETILGPGGSATVEPGTVHDWWQVGDEEAQALVEVVPGVGFVEMVGTLFGLARDGKVSPEGMPGPLQLAVMAQAYGDVVTFTSPPPIVQRVTLPPLALIGRLLGRRPFHPEYLESDEVEVPDPAALAELTPDGRLRPFD